jgi:hypothetical protein
MYVTQSTCLRSLKDDRALNGLGLYNWEDKLLGQDGHRVGLDGKVCDSVLVDLQDFPAKVHLE